MVTVAAVKPDVHPVAPVPVIVAPVKLKHDVPTEAIAGEQT